MADVKEFAVKASIDIGDNIAGLLEKLASHIGTTTDKLFPWYVKQQVLEGYTFFLMLGIAFISSLSLLIFASSRKEPYFIEKEIPTVKSFLTFISFILIFFCFMSLFVNGSESIQQINNPEYFALKAIVLDMSKLIR